MKTLLKYICIAAAVSLLAGCSKDELSIPGRAESIEFIMRPTTFNGVDVSEASTKALLPEEVTPIESAIYSKYYMIFDKDGNVVKIKGQNVTTLGVDETSMVLSPESGTGPFRICFFANISKSYLNSISNYYDLSTKPIELEYADHEETGYIGIPVIDGNMCFPMYGEVVFPSADVTPVNNKVIVPLERLFAKVVLNLKAYFDASIGDLLLDSPDLTLFSYSLNNLPNSVLPVSPSETPWADGQSDARFNNYDIDINDVTIDNSNILYDEFTQLPKYSTFYVPEYIIKPIEGAENETDQKLKPTLIDPDKRPVYLSMQAKAHQSNFVDVPLEYKIYLGGNAVNDFSLRRNTQYNNYMTITGTGEAIMGIDHRVEAGYYNLANPDNSGADDPANCYIISKPGRYMIPLYRGNDTGQIISGAESVEVINLNGSASNVVTSSSLTTDESGKPCVIFNSNISADASGAASLATVAEGNKLLVVKNSAGQVLWSWHLWYCDDDRRPDIESLNNVYPTTSAVVMNRALGATNRFGIEQEIPLIGAINLAQWTDGFYYQWGRKDPMLTSGNTTANSATYEKSVQNPRTFYTDWTGSESGSGWSETKTINDPCPPGYKVPSNDIWRTGSNSSGMEDLLNSITPFIPNFDGYPYNLEVGLNLRVNIVFPYAGYIDQNGNHSSGDTGKTTYPTYATGTSTIGQLLFPISGNRRFRNVACKETEINISGNFWSNSKSDITYYRKGSTIEILNCEYDTASRTVLGVPISWNNSWKAITAAELTESERQAIETNISLREGVLNWGDQIETKLEIVTQSISPVKAYNVRCVREDSPVQ